VKKAREGMKAGAGEAAVAAVAEATKMLDQAASKGVIHRNQAARRKGRLMTHLAALERQGMQEAVAPKAPSRRRATGTTTTTRTTTPRATRTASTTRTTTRRSPTTAPTTAPTTTPTTAPTTTRTTTRTRTPKPTAES
jgi:hypothetical protein